MPTEIAHSNAANAPKGSTCFRVDGSILPWLSDEERDANILLLDFDADQDNETTVRLDLNIVFNPRPVRRGKITRRDDYVGTTGAEITLTAKRGKICSHTSSVLLGAKYTNSIKLKRRSALKLVPSLKLREGTNESGANVGSIYRDAEVERTCSSEFENQERYLDATVMHDTVRWTIALPRGQKVIRDFLIGNLYLFAECSWPINVQKTGYIKVRPLDFRFFDNQCGPLSTRQSLVMGFVLWQRGRRFENIDGFRTDFEEVADE